MLKDGFKKVIEKLALVGGLLVLVMSILTTLDIISREVLNKGIPGGYEVVQYLMVLIVFFPLAYVESKQGNVRVELFLMRFPKQFQTIIAILSGFGALVIFAWLLYTSSIYAWESWLMKETMYGVKGGPLYLWKAAVPLCCFLMCVQVLIGLKRLLMRQDSGGK